MERSVISMEVNDFTVDIDAKVSLDKDAIVVNVSLESVDISVSMVSNVVDDKSKILCSRTESLLKSIISFDNWL